MERDLHTLLTAARNDDDALEALKVLRGIRDRLDTTERALIESARNSGASWATIATALGLTSRQAAEQRHLRLGGNGGQNRDVAPARAARHRQRTVDTHHGPAIARLRTATRTLLRRVEADEAWPNRFTRAALAKDTLTMAVDATPGALYALATSVIDDLRQATETELPQPIAKAAEDLQKALT
ncbi:hypothetical protein SAMN05421812_10853 [Asanoa hainanensis]|uniref:Uncharacterized protein n=1 Tax=Asanoa hainanensis TaxID=560556 RepID=A0A239N9X2_9ACTN|nr:hypothetical protein [Asanoa hainanensis]SNT51726.1 hypothetical protein SAMN05421812_10853 [Asanoa hainanensis]